MLEDHVYTVASDARLIDLMERAGRRLIVVSPGLTAAVTDCAAGGVTGSGAGTGAGRQGVALLCQEGEYLPPGGGPGGTRTDDAIGMLIGG